MTNREFEAKARLAAFFCGIQRKCGCARSTGRARVQRKCLRYSIVFRDLRAMRADLTTSDTKLGIAEDEGL